MARLTEDAALGTNAYDVINLPKTVTFSDDTLGAQNCVTFVVAVLKSNGITEYDIEYFHRMFKCDETAPSKLTFRGAIYRKASADDYLYHVTYVGSLPNIASGGLHPGGGVSFGKGYSGYSAGKLFLTAWDGVGFWIDRLGDMANNRADNPVQDGLIPIVVRVPDRAFEELEDDPVGSKDSMSDAYTTTESIHPSILEVWDGANWAPIKNIDHKQLIKEAYDAAEKEYEDGEELVYLNENQFEPNLYLKSSRHSLL